MNLQKNKRPEPPIDSNHFVARLWWTCLSIVSAIQTLMSGKRNEVVDFGIVKIERARLLRWHEWEFYPAAALPSRRSQDLLHAPEDQFFRGSAFPRGARLEPAVNVVRDVHGRSHTAMLPYLWSIIQPGRMARPELPGLKPLFGAVGFVGTEVPTSRDFTGSRPREPFDPPRRRRRLRSVLFRRAELQLGRSSCL